MRLCALTLIVIVCSVLWAHCEDIYVSQSGAGAQSGTACDTARSLAWANDNANWGSGANKISHGDIVHMCGTFTSQFYITAGNAENAIILFEPGAKFSAPFWANGAIRVEHFGITIDGGVDGLIEATDNGTLLGNQAASYGVVSTGGGSYLTIKNLRILNMYVRQGGSSDTGGGVGIQNITSSSVGYLINFTVTNCTIINATVGIQSDYRGACSNYTFIGNTISNVNWGGNAGDTGAGSTLRNLVVANNRICVFTNFDIPDNSLHHNAFYAWAESGGTLYNVDFTGNECHGPCSVGTPNNGTGYLFISGAGAVGPFHVFNNVFVDHQPGNPPPNGQIIVWPAANSVVRIYNNTFIGDNIGGNAMQLYNQRGGQTYDVKNNLCIAKTFVNVTFNATINLSCDYNLGYTLVSGQEYSWSTTSGSVFRTFAQWQALGFDGNSSIADPLLNANYVPQAGSPASGTGTNLSAYFTTDKNGATRNTWDIGAYNVEAGASAPAIASVHRGNVVHRGRVTLR